MNADLSAWVRAVNEAVHDPALCASFPEDALVVPPIEKHPLIMQSGTEWALHRGQSQGDEVMVVTLGAQPGGNVVQFTRLRMLYQLAVFIHSQLLQMQADEETVSASGGVVGRLTRMVALEAQAPLLSLSFLGELPRGVIVTGVALTQDNSVVLKGGGRDWETPDEIIVAVEWEAE